MKDQEINIAIAEACGWVWYRIPNPGKRDREHRMLAHPVIHEYPDQSPEWLVRADGSERICNWEYMVRGGHLSDYCHDLNAMHDAEEYFKDKDDFLWSSYAEDLECVAEEPLWHATARQRAEAFLRTIGKWKESYTT